MFVNTSSGDVALSDALQEKRNLGKKNTACVTIKIYFANKTLM